MEPFPREEVPPKRQINMDLLDLEIYLRWQGVQ